MSSYSYAGNRWYKCDLHLHTAASKCFQDRNVTAEQWVERAIEAGLNCVAVTDHNTGEMIDEIKRAAHGRQLVVFPGVEITCDTSKVHLLILFDTDKESQDINDFLIRCEINREDFAEQTASTRLSIFEVAAKADELGAIVIPAHIDEFNGLGSVSHQHLTEFYQLPYINAVQVVHSAFVNANLSTSNNQPLKDLLNEYYNNPTPPIDYNKIADWYRPVKLALEAKLAVTTFSDNPHEPKNSRHGLAGIGTRYTWIKMDEQPSLEGLRQALLLPEFRVKSDFDANAPYRTPNLWIKSITINDTFITKDTEPLTINFSPQLTTIIGGRGSGKSSILRFIRGLFNRTLDLNDLNEILHDHNEFYKRQDIRTKKGVLKDGSSITIEFIRNSILHRIVATNILNSVSQNIVIEKWDASSGNWILESSESYLDFFLFEQYSQKQIYEIAQEPNSFRERIDRSIPQMANFKSLKEQLRREYLEVATTIRTLRQRVSTKGRVQTELTDIDERIRLFQSSGISDLLSTKGMFIRNEALLNEVVESLETREQQIQNLIETLPFEIVDLTGFSDNHKSFWNRKLEEVKTAYDNIIDELITIKERAEEVKDRIKVSISESEWKTELTQNSEEVDRKKTELEQQGINDVSIFEALSEERLVKERELRAIQDDEDALLERNNRLNELQTQHLAIVNQITTARRDFVNTVMHDEKVKVSIQPLRNKADFIHKLRAILQRQEHFEYDVEYLSSVCFNGSVERTMPQVRDIFARIRSGESVEGISGYFVTLVNNLSDSQLDELQLLWPEDELEISYKPTGATVFKPLSSASPGQKTTAILTLILSQTDKPLILDQPEDDLDNRLVYELIVDRIKHAKEHRQLIVVTHNANIPVNGDAEYIVSMNSESKHLEVYCSGTVEQPNVKKEICDVMEGTEQAFDMRSKRYKIR